MPLIEDKQLKEYEIFDILGDQCIAEEFAEKFKELYPDDIKTLSASFENDRNRGKTINRCINEYLYDSFKTGKKRYRNYKGIKYLPPIKKQKEQAEYKTYRITDLSVLYKIADNRLLHFIEGVVPNKNNPGQYLWFFQKSEEITRIINEHRNSETITNQ